LHRHGGRRLPIVQDSVWLSAVNFAASRNRPVASLRGSSWTGVDEAKAYRKLEQFGAISYPQLTQNLGAVVANRCLADVEPLGDDLVRQSLGQQPHDLLLASRQGLVTGCRVVRPLRLKILDLVYIFSRHRALKEISPRCHDLQCFHELFGH